MANKFGLKHFNIFAPYRRLLKAAKIFANKVENKKAEYAALTNDQLSGKTTTFEEALNKGNNLDSILVDAFATAREAIYRVTGIFAYLEQIIGAYIEHCGDFAELYTGEGKTIVCIIAAYANSLQHKGVHIVTVNEYLVQRDADFCAQCLNPLGITVGYNLASFSAEEKEKCINVILFILFTLN